MFSYYKKFTVNDEEYFFASENNEIFFGYKHPNYKGAYDRTNLGGSVSVLTGLKTVFDEWNSNSIVDKVEMKAGSLELIEVFHNKIFTDTEWTLSSTQSVTHNNNTYIKYSYI
jgi:hypothetical protein